MKKFLRNTKGAVTVFVTFLLIPAILVSGTAVDLARIYTARSIVQDANQLAANAVLSQYNALLHDLYGVFGVAENDPVLAQLLDDYIAITVFGEDGRDTSLGTLQLFYGSNLSMEDVTFPEEKNLRNPDVLRRQIEEYMKFRGPVIIVKEILELLGSSTFNEDSKVISDKLKIDDAIAEMYDKYKELYDAIQKTDLYPEVPGGYTGGTVGTVSSSLSTIRDEFVALNNCYDDWFECYEEWDTETDAEKKEDLQEDLDEYEAHYKAILANIEIRTVGGKAGKNWKKGGWSDYTGTLKGLNQTIIDAINRADGHKADFDKIVDIAKELDGMNAELTSMVNDLEARLKDGMCNEELRDSLTVPTPGSDKSVIEMYKEILKWDDIETMAAINRDGGYQYIDGPLKDTLRNAKYRNKNNPGDSSLTREELERAQSISDLQIENAEDLVSKLAGYSEVGYGMPAGFIKFGGHPGDNAAFFAELQAMMEVSDVPLTALFDGQEEADGENSKEKQEGMIDELLSLVNSAYTGMTNNPIGAKYINGSSTDDDDSDTSDITKAAEEAASNPVSDVISNPGTAISRASNYLLLLTYCTSMFSNYTTARPESNGKTMDDIAEISFPMSVSGVPISPEVNYFFQSEWEYLYYGNENAGKNLNAVSRLIYIIRVICNYITVFSVSEVNNIVRSIRAAFAFPPAVGFLLGELARAAFVAAESVVDLATLRAGYKVPLIKSGKKGEWVCSPSGLANVLEDLFAESVDGDDDKGKDKDDKGLSYSNYLLFFMLAKGFGGESAAAELTDRTADLIEWNVINYECRVWCDEEKMAEALSATDRLKMEDMKTDLKLTTTVDMKMLFLSMAVAQNFAEARSIGLSQTFPFTVTDYRGY